MASVLDRSSFTKTIYGNWHDHARGSEFDPFPRHNVSSPSLFGAKVMTAEKLYSCLKVLDGIQLMTWLVYDAPMRVSRCFVYQEDGPVTCEVDVGNLKPTPQCKQ